MSLLYIVELKLHTYIHNYILIMYCNKVVDKTGIAVPRFTFTSISIRKGPNVNNIMN